MTTKKIVKNWEKSGKEEKSGKNQEKEEKSERKGQNRVGSFTLPLLTNRAGYATGSVELDLHASFDRVSIKVWVDDVTANIKSYTL